MNTSLILHKGHVTHVIDPSSFWMRMGTDADFHEFEVYQSTLDKYYNQTGRHDCVSVDSLSLGECVIVADTGREDIPVACDDENHTEFHHWNRAKVSRVADDKVDVFYIDLGNTEIVNISNVKNINQELFDYIPPQVIQLGIAGIKPLARSWTSRAITMFESKVLKQEVVASLIEYDDTNKYGQVVIYIRQDDCTWHSLAHEMFEEDLGLPVEPIPAEFLGQETVLAALRRAEQESELSMQSLENISDGDDDDGTEDKHEVDSQQQRMSTPERGMSMSSQRSDSHPPDLTLQQQPSSTALGCKNSAVGVPAFNLYSLKSTRFLSLSKMQEDKNEEYRQQTRARLEQEIQDDDENEEENFQEIEWGKTDLQIGEVSEFPDFDKCIRQEIYKHSPRASSQEDLTEFFHEKPRSIDREQSSTQQFDFQETVQGNTREKVHLKQLPEVEDYKIQKKIEEILLDKDDTELELVCVLIHSVIEPDIDVPRDHLVAIFTAIFETLIHHSTVDRLIGIGALETYLETRAFEEAIKTTLRSLVGRFIKLTKTTQSPGQHRPFAEVLAILFIRADQWPSSAGSIIELFVMRSLEHWTIFNKQRAQNGESCVKLEHLYMECVETITDTAWEALSHKFPERCCFLLEEIKHKLLHDSTDRIVRIQLLNILLKRQAHHSLLTPTKPSSKDVAMQTEDRNASPVITASQDSCEGRDFSDRSTDNSKGFYRPPSGRLYSHGDSYTPDLDGSFDASEVYYLGSMLDQHNQDCYTNTSSASLHDTGISRNVQAEDNKMLMSQTANKLPAHRHVLPSSGFTDKYTAGKVRGCEIKSLRQPSVLNVTAPEFIVRSTSCLTQQLDKRLYPSDAQPYPLVTDTTSPKLRASSQDIDNDAVKFERFVIAPPQDKEIDLSNGGTDEEDSCSVGICADESVENEVSGNSDEIYVSVCSSLTDLEQYRSELNCEPSERTVKPTDGTVKPTERTVKPTDGTVKPTERTVKPTDGTVKPTERTVKPTDGTVKPTERTVKPTEHTVKPTERTVKPTERTVKPTDGTVKPTESTVKPTETENKTAKMKYTPQELKAFNTHWSAPVIALDTVDETCEINFAVENAEIPPKPDQYKDVKTLSSVPLHRYSGSGDSPLEISEGPTSNAANWKRLSELLPANCFKPGYINSGTSVDPDHLEAEVDDDPSVGSKSGSLIDIAKGLLLPTSQPESEKNVSGSNESNSLFNEISNESTGGKSADLCDTASTILVSSGEDQESCKPEWPDKFFTSAKPVLEKDITPASAAINLVHQNSSKELKGKKKKIKFRPISEVLAYKSSYHNDSNQTEATPSDLDLQDNLNGDLETQSEGIPCQIIHQPRLGALSGTSGNRSSLLADLRKERPKADPWVPGRRKCTFCASEDHTIYDCTMKDPLRNMSDDHSYMF